MNDKIFVSLFNKLIEGHTEIINHYCETQCEKPKECGDKCEVWNFYNWLKEANQK